MKRWITGISLTLLMLTSLAHAQAHADEMQVLTCRPVLDSTPAQPKLALIFVRSSDGTLIRGLLQSTLETPAGARLRRLPLTQVSQTEAAAEFRVAGAGESMKGLVNKPENAAELDGGVPRIYTCEADASSAALDVTNELVADPIPAGWAEAAAQCSPSQGSTPGYPNPHFAYRHRWMCCRAQALALRNAGTLTRPFDYDHFAAWCMRQ